MVIAMSVKQLTDLIESLLLREIPTESFVSTSQFSEDAHRNANGADIISKVPYRPQKPSQELLGGWDLPIKYRIHLVRVHPDPGVIHNVA